MQRTSWSTGLSVSAGGVGVVAHASSVAARLLGDRAGLTAELSKAMLRRNFNQGHDHGRVLTDVAVMLAEMGVRRSPASTCCATKPVCSAPSPHRPRCSALWTR